MVEKMIKGIWLKMYDYMTRLRHSCKNFYSWKTHFGPNLTLSYLYVPLLKSSWIIIPF
jgi:hypothetical protein